MEVENISVDQGTFLLRTFTSLSFCIIEGNHGMYVSEGGGGGEKGDESKDTRTQGLFSVRAFCRLNYRGVWSTFDIFSLLN